MSRHESAYLRICSAIEEDIHTGKLRHGNRLPSEHWLAQHFGVSRMTVRQALSELASKRLITTRAGSGSYITFDDRPLAWKLGWSQAMMCLDAHVETRVLYFGPIDAPELGASFQTGVRFIALDRLRLLDGVRPISLERSRIPLDARTEMLLDIDFSRESLMDALIHRAGLIPGNSEEWIEVTRLRSEEAHLLERAVSEAFMLIRCATRTTDGNLIEHVSSLLDPSHFRLHINSDLGK